MGDSGIVMEDVCEDGMQNLGRRLVSMLMRAGILVGGVVVVVVGVMVVAVGIVSFSEEQCLPRIQTQLSAGVAWFCNHKTAIPSCIAI